MTGDSPIPQRRSMRLPGFDYSLSGAYCVTIVTRDREPLFGEIINQEMRLSLAGECAASVWVGLPRSFSVEINAWVLMPNHLHGILVIRDEHLDAKIGAMRSTFNGTHSGSLNAIVQNFKSVSTRRINALRNKPGVRVWQRNYYEHVIRNDDDWARIADYIEANPARWEDDQEFFR